MTFADEMPTSPWPESDGVVVCRVDRDTFARIKEIFDQPPSGEGFERLMRASAPWTPTSP